MISESSSRPGSDFCTFITEIVRKIEEFALLNEVLRLFESGYGEAESDDSEGGLEDMKDSEILSGVKAEYVSLIYQSLGRSLSTATIMSPSKADPQGQVWMYLMIYEGTSLRLLVSKNSPTAPPIPSC